MAYTVKLLQPFKDRINVLSPIINRFLMQYGSRKHAILDLKYLSVIQLEGTDGRTDGNFLYKYRRTYICDKCI